MARKNSNGYGGVTKLSGKRKKPYMAYISQMKAEGKVIPPSVKNALKSNIEALQTASDYKEAALILAEAILSIDSALNDVPPIEEYKAAAVKSLEDHLKKKTFKAKQLKKPIGYFATQAEANIALAEYNKKPYDLDGTKLTFAEVYELAKKELNLEKKSVSFQNAHIQGFKKNAPIHNMPVSEIRHAHMQEVVAEYAGSSAGVQAQITMIQRVVFKYALKNDIVEKDYSEFVTLTEVKEKKKKTPFSREEVQILWDNIDLIYKGQAKAILENLPIVKVALILIYTGVRIEELLSLKSSDVHLSERYIDLRGTKTPAAQRIVPIHKAILPIVEEFLSQGNETLIAKDGKIAYSNFSNTAWAFLKKELNMDHTIHEARHTFATFSKASKLDETLRQYILGHASKNITDDVYTHPEMLLPELLEEIDKYNIVT